VGGRDARGPREGGRGAPKRQQQLGFGVHGGLIVERPECVNPTAGGYRPAWHRQPAARAGGGAGRFGTACVLGVADQAMVVIAGCGSPSSACSRRCRLVA